MLGHRKCGNMVNVPDFPSSFTQAQLLRPFSSFRNLNYQFSDQNKAAYHSMILNAPNRFARGMTLLAAWTWSRNVSRTAPSDTAFGRITQQANFPRMIQLG